MFTDKEEVQILWRKYRNVLMKIIKLKQSSIVVWCHKIHTESVRDEYFDLHSFNFLVYIGLLFYSFSPTYSNGASRAWLGDFENPVFEAGKLATLDGML